MKIRSKKQSDPRMHALKTLFLASYPARSRFAEAYRTLRTNVQFSFMEGAFGTLLITSAGQEEGKTITAANLAFSIAQAGRSVLMIDADLRKPFLSRLIRTQESPGLTGLLSDLLGTAVKNGPLGRVGVSDLVRLLELQKRSGVLHLTDKTHEVKLFFLQGELVDCEWTTCPQERTLVQRLVANKVISAEDGQRVLVRSKETGQKPGFVLVHTGAAKWDDLVGTIELHLTEALRTAVQFSRGTFSFVSVSEFQFDRQDFYPVDLGRIYQQVVAAGESTPFLEERIRGSLIKTPQPGLFLLPSGIMPPNPSELLGSRRMAFLLARLKSIFEVLVIDSPPILPASDAILLAPHADGVVFVVKAGKVNREAARKAVDQLRLAKARLLGVVLNEVDAKKGGYYYRYYEEKYYSRYYGEDQEE